MKVKGIVLGLLVSTALMASFSIEAIAQSKPYIAVISKGEQHDFWQQVKKGSLAAAEKYNVNVTFEGPPSESDIQTQVEMLKTALAKSPVAIALAALDTESVLDQLEVIKSKKIPVVGFDSGVVGAPAGVVYATVATDNYHAAGMAASKMFEKISSRVKSASNDKPVKIAVISQDVSSLSVRARGQGFRDAMIDLVVKSGVSVNDIKVTGNPAFIDAKNPTKGSKVIIDMVVPASAAMTDTAATISAVLNKVSAEQILGIFCSNEGTAKGILAATNDGADLPSKYKNLVVIGFDAGLGQKNAVRAQYFLGSITQDPYAMGFKVLEQAYKAYKGEKVADVDTGAVFYDKSNIDAPELQGRLYN